MTPLRLIVFLCLALPCFAQTQPKKTEGHHRFILCNDGATLGAPDREAPIGIEGLVEETIGPLRDTMINTLYWQLGTDPYFGTATARLSDWYTHKTQVGSIWGAGREQFKTAGEWRIAENSNDLMKQGTDAAAVIIDYGHRAGLEVLLSLRINDGHDGSLPQGIRDENMAPQRQAHPEWLLGDEAEVTPQGRSYSRYAYNFGVPEVRSYVLALAREAIENHDADGFDFDFCRQPSLFKKGEGAKSAGLITALLREVREALDQKSVKVGRKLRLSVRIPPRMEENRVLGLDTETWVKSGLVDILVVGDYGWNYRLPIEQYVELAKGTGCEIIAQNLDAYREEPGRSARVLFGEKRYYSPEHFRAVAANHWQAGAQGQYIWNQHFLKFAEDEKVDLRSWKEIGEPEALVQKDKHYRVGPLSHGGVLPITLRLDAPANVNVEIADDVAGQRKAGVGVHATLRLNIEQLTSLDAVNFELNGVRLSREGARARLNYNDCWLDFDVTDLMAKGNNALVLKMTRRNPHVAAPVVLRGVEALIDYEP